MRQIKFLIIVLLLLSCDPDDDNSSTANASILGDWQLESVVFGFIEEPLDDCERMQILTFMDNGSIEAYYDVTGNCDFETTRLNYSLEEDVLTIIFPIEGGSYTERNSIEGLNATTLKYTETWNSVDGDLLPESQSTYTYNRLE
jgi:hypothetical protein